MYACNHATWRALTPQGIIDHHVIYASAARYELFRMVFRSLTDLVEFLRFRRPEVCYLSFYCLIVRVIISYRNIVRLVYAAYIPHSIGPRRGTRHRAITAV